MTIAAGVIDEVVITALLAAPELTAERRSPAFEHGAHHPGLRRAQRAGLQVAGSEGTEHVSQCRAHTVGIPWMLMALGQCGEQVERVGRSGRTPLR